MMPAATAMAMSRSVAMIGQFERILKQLRMQKLEEVALLSLKKVKQPAGGVYPVLPATIVNTVCPPLVVTILIVCVVPLVAGQNGNSIVALQACPSAPITSCAELWAARGAVPDAPPVSVSAVAVPAPFFVTMQIELVLHVTPPAALQTEALPVSDVSDVSMKALAAVGMSM